MCNYKYNNKNSNRHNQPCIYPKLYSTYKSKFTKELMIDSDGYCLFHSKNDKWKIENGFEKSFFELIGVISELNESKKLQDREYFFSGFQIPKLETFIINGIQFNGDIVLSSCIVNSPFEIINTTIKYLDIENSTFNEKLYFKDVDLSGNVMANNSTYYKGLGFNQCKLQNHLFFNSCKFYNKDETASCEVGIKKCDPVYYINFQDSVIKSRFAVMRSSLTLEMNFNNCLIEDEFIFEQSTITGTINLVETEFTLKMDKNPFMSSTHFGNIELSEKGKIVFKGKIPQQDMVRSELTIHFKNKPKGLIYFENFNLNKIGAKSKERIFELEKEGIVEINKGCRKYYCQTDYFTIDTTKATQKLILDLVKVFCNYFELHESANLGVELVERTDSYIRYFYFTDEEITQENFLKRINNAEYNIWQTFSNLSNYSAANFKDIEEQHIFLDLGVLFLKLGNYIQRNLSFVDDISKLLSSISARTNLIYENPSKVKMEICQGHTIVQTDELLEFVLNGINKYSNNTPKLTINMDVNQNFYGPIEQVINTDNFYQGNKKISEKEEKSLREDIDEIDNEKNAKSRESKWEKFLKEWGGTISEISMGALKGILMP